MPEALRQCRRHAMRTNLHHHSPRTSQWIDKRRSKRTWLPRSWLAEQEGEPGKCVRQLAITDASNHSAWSLIGRVSMNLHLACDRCSPFDSLCVRPTFQPWRITLLRELEGEEECKSHKLKCHYDSDSRMTVKICRRGITTRPYNNGGNNTADAPVQHAPCSYHSQEESHETSFSSKQVLNLMDFSPSIRPPLEYPHFRTNPWHHVLYS